MRDPFQGIGKPEPLKFPGSGVWSRRITQEHRIVYVVGHERIDFIQLELLQGAKDEFEWRRLDEYLESQYYLEAGK